jgi:23S rRNA pseudouridine1911/1915/1917 synthase
MPGEFRRRELVDDKFIVTYTIDDFHDGWRADQFLKTRYRVFSRNKLQEQIADGKIELVRSFEDIASQRLKPSTTLRVGDRVRVFSPRLPEPPVELSYKILYEDEHALVIDKPGNLPVHPAGKFLFNTLLMVLRQERADWCAKGYDFHMIHRLDRETSGVILIAKGAVAASKLILPFRNRTVEKRYAAIVEGSPSDDKFSVDADLGSAPGSDIRLKMAAFPKGTGPLEALTHFKVLERRKRGALIDCQLVTGRQHQIRVHLAHAGHPIIGDKLYGANDRLFLDFIGTRKLTDDARAALGGIERHALHSRYLRFYHELAGKWIEVESPLPADMEGLLRAL